jgi:hypothetical protein
MQLHIRTVTLRTDYFVNFSNATQRAPSWGVNEFGGETCPMMTVANSQSYDEDYFIHA